MTSCWIARVRSTSCTFPRGIRTVCPRALRPITTRRPRQSEPSVMRRRSLSAVEEYYRGRQVRVFRLKREAILPELENRARRLLAERPEVLEVRLFGSLIKGNAGPGSDADILIVLSESEKSFLDRIAD